MHKPRGILTRQPSHRHRFNITFDPGYLSGKEDVLMRAHLHGCRKHPRPVYIGIAMNLTELQELGVFESGNRPKHACLLAITQMILKSDQAVRVGHQVFLP